MIPATPLVTTHAATNSRSAQPGVPTPFFSPIARHDGGYDWVQVSVNLNGEVLDAHGDYQSAPATA